jgi:hypothetical protein
VNKPHLLVLTCLLFLPITLSAQSGGVSKPGTVTTAEAAPKTAKELEAERLFRERRAQAQSLLVQLATDAGTFNDQRLRARTQARIADSLWETDLDRARSLFRKAWDAAEAADAEGQQRMRDEAREQQAKSGGGGYAVNSPPDLRKEVLRLAVKHDTALGEEFLRKLQEKNKGVRAKDDPIDPGDKDPAATQRLDGARELLSSGDKERALEFAGPLFNSVSWQAIEFLLSLREKNAALADQRFASMLNLAAANPQSDLNTVAILSSYIFTPHAFYMMVGPSRFAIAQQTARAGIPDVAPGMRLAFLQVAGEVLMRPIQPGPDTNLLFAYYALQNYLPLFEQFGTPELTAGVRTQLDAVTAMVPENQRRLQNEQASLESSPQQRTRNMEQSVLDRIDRAQTSAERDQLYMQLAMSRAGAGDPAARDYADKIDDSELRQTLRAYIDASLAMTAIEKKDAERALEIVRTGELNHLQKVWTMTGAARLLMVGKPDRERALQILDDASAEARRMEGSDPDRPRAFVAVANTLLRIDPVRSWDSMTDVVKAANAAPDFTGEDGELSFRIITKTSRSMHQHTIADFDLAGLFRNLANLDFDRAVALARVFEHEAPRAHAVMAIALAVLNEKKQ